MSFDNPNDSLAHRVNATIHESIKWLCLGGCALVSLYWFVDTYVVAPDRRVYYTVLRALVSLAFLCQFFIVRALAPGRYTVFNGYCFYSIYVTLFFCAVIGAGIYPSPYYGAPMLMISSMTIVPWRPIHTVVISAAISLAWMILNFHSGLVPIFVVHLKYLIGLSAGVIYTSFLHHRATVKLQAQALEVQEALQQTQRVAMQTSHDIRSPIAALKFASDGAQSIDGAGTQIIRMAAQRIDDIANNLARQHGAQVRDKPNAPILLSPLIDSVISEKRTIMQQRGVTFSFAKTFDSASAFAAVDRAMFQRAVSNLLNNAAESMIDGGLVTIGIEIHDDNVLILIRDQGCGIEPNRISDILKGGRSFGKRGSGLGLSGAVTLLKEWKGSLDLTSKLGSGTEVRLTLPRRQAPAWFCAELVFPANFRVLSLDDDPAMGRLWQRRIEPLLGPAAIATFTNPSTFRARILEDDPSCLYLVDVELPGTSCDGISIVRHHGIASKTVFVTSHYEEQSLSSLCAAGARVLPKSLAGAVPLRVLHKAAKRAG